MEQAVLNLLNSQSPSVAIAALLLYFVYKNWGVLVELVKNSTSTNQKLTDTIQALKDSTDKHTQQIADCTKIIERCHIQNGPR